MCAEHHKYWTIPVLREGTKLKRLPVEDAYGMFEREAKLLAPSELSALTAQVCTQRGLCAAVPALDSACEAVNCPSVHVLELCVPHTHLTPVCVRDVCVR